MFTDVSVIALDNPDFLVGSYCLAHNRKNSLSQFGLVAIFVDYLSQLISNRKYDLTGTCIPFLRFMTIESHLLAIGGEIPFIIS